MREKIILSLKTGILLLIVVFGISNVYAWGFSRSSDSLSNTSQRVVSDGADSSESPSIFSSITSAVGSFFSALNPVNLFSSFFDTDISSENSRRGSVRHLPTEEEKEEILRSLMNSSRNVPNGSKKTRILNRVRNRSGNRLTEEDKLKVLGDITGDSSFLTCEEAGEELKNKLSSINTDVDFSFYLEKKNGENFLFEKGNSSINKTYESASLSKWVTGTIILRLVDQGYLNLDDKPQNYIENWPISKSSPLYNMTLRDLLSFTSGLKNPRAISCINSPRKKFESCVLSLIEKNKDNQTVPGTKFYYSSIHLQVAGLMAIKARGVNSWQDLFSEFQSQTGLFLNSSYDLPSKLNPRLAGGMHYTGKDYSDFLRVYYNGLLLNRSMFEQATRDQIKLATIEYSPAKESIQEDWHYGLGLWLECSSSAYNCSGTERISSPGSYGAYPFIDYPSQVFGIIARQGDSRTFSNGYSVYTSTKNEIENWANCR